MSEKLSSTDTIRMDPWGDGDDESTAVMVFTGEQWEMFGPHYESIHDAREAMRTLMKWREHEICKAMNATLGAALNSGDGSYRP